MAIADWRLAVPTAALVRRLRVLPALTSCRACATSRRPAPELRSLVMGRVVDSYTNILTVKLFARARDEDAYVREVIDEHTGAIAAHMRLITPLHGDAVDDERAAAGEHRDDRHHAVGAGRGQRRPGRDRAAAGLADRQRGRLGELGSDRHLREHRRGAGRHGDDRGAAHAGRPARCARARGAARRDPLRAPDLHLRPQRRQARARRPEPRRSGRASASAWSAARAPASRRW